MARAFDHDPVTRWHVPDDDQRIPVMTRYFSFALPEIFLPLGAVWTTEDRLGAAVWVPSQVSQPEPDAQEPSTSPIDEIFGNDAWMVTTILRVQEEHKPAEPHHYLPFMGTRPDHQGQGIGTGVVLDTFDLPNGPRFWQMRRTPGGVGRVDG